MSRNTYTDAALAYGSLVADYPIPYLVDAPEGSRVKLRFNQRDIIKAYVRYKNGMFSLWSVEWADPKKRTLKLHRPIANTVHQNAPSQPILAPYSDPPQCAIDRSA